MEVKALDESTIRNEVSYNQLVQRPRTNLGGTLDKNPLEGLVRPMQKFD